MDTEDDMKTFVKSIEINSKASNAEIISNCKRILAWLEEAITPRRKLSSENVNFILYSAAIVQAYLKICDSNMHMESTFHNEPRLMEILKGFDESSPLVYYAKKILEISENALDHIPIVQYYFKILLDDEQFNQTVLRRGSSITVDSFAFADEDEQKEQQLREQGMKLVARIFQLRNEDIPVAIDRLIENCKFELIAKIVSEANSSDMYKKCLIIQHEICMRLDAGNISPKFITSLYVLSASNMSGLKIFYQCLRKENFSVSLKNFFLDYLQKIEKFDEQNLLIEISDKRYREYSFEEVTFLVGAMLSLKSPVRIEMYKEVYISVRNPLLIDFINQRKFVYDY